MYTIVFTVLILVVFFAILFVISKKDTSVRESFNVNNQKSGTNPYRDIQDAFILQANQTINTVINSGLCNSKLTKPVVIIETLAVLYVIADFAVLSSKGDRNSVSVSLLTTMAKSYMRDMPEVLRGKLDDRISFYGEVIRKKKLRGECFPGIDFSKEGQFAAIRCAVAFTDCMVNPKCILDYKNAPIKPIGITEMVQLTEEFANPTLRDFVDFFKSVYDKTMY